MKTLKRIAGALAAAAVLSAGLFAQGTPIPLTLLAEEPGQEAATGTDATSSASVAGPPGRFLGFKDREAFHRFAGWTSGGLLLAAGVIGAVHGLEMMNEAHDWRDAHGIEDEDDTEYCVAEIKDVWNEPGAQALRWTHVGLLAAGETLYLTSAFTGTSFWHALPPGWSRARIHRYAFFVHAGLMAAEGVLGFMLTDALRRGDHGDMTDLLAAHTAIGIAIPVVIIGAGIAIGPRKDG